VLLRDDVDQRRHWVGISLDVELEKAGGARGEHHTKITTMSTR
jgi:hypothetical protein